MTQELNVLRDQSHGKYDAVGYADRNEWLAGRANSIGASEVAAVLGKSPWMTERELWESKMHPTVSKGNADTDRGTRSESHIRELYGIEMGCRVYDGTNIILRSVSHPFMTASLDGFILEKDGPCVMEIKSIRNGGVGSWGEDIMPNYYLLQVLAQLVVTGWKEAILVARFCRSAGWEKAKAFERVYHVHADDYTDAMDKLVQKVKSFWDNHVLTKKAPAVSVPSI